MTKQRVIIFDSPDGTGKTEISTELSRVLEIPYFRMDSQHSNWRNKRFKDALEFDQTYISSFLKQTGCSVIFDRAYPAEWVYSRVFKRETNELALTQVDLAFASLGTTIVVPLRRDYSQNREDEVVPKDKLQALHDGYLSFCEWTRCNTIKMYVDDYSNNLRFQIPSLLEALMYDGRRDIVLEVTT